LAFFTRRKEVRRTLVANLGEILWDLPQSLLHNAGAEISCSLYITNSTSIDREYTLVAQVVKNGVVVSEFTVPVDSEVWFTVEAQNTIKLPGSVKVDYTDTVLILNLGEKQSNTVVDTVSVALTSQNMVSILGPVAPVLVVSLMAAMLPKILLGGSR